MNGKRFVIFISVMAAVIAALVIGEIKLDERHTWDECYPMANAKITWQQSFHSGGWSE